MKNFQIILLVPLFMNFNLLMAHSIIRFKDKPIKLPRKLQDQNIDDLYDNNILTNRTEAIDQNTPTADLKVSIDGNTQYIDNSGSDTDNGSAQNSDIFINTDESNITDNNSDVDTQFDTTTLTSRYGSDDKFNQSDPSLITNNEYSEDIQTLPTVEPNQSGTNFYEEQNLTNDIYSDPYVNVN